MSWGTLPVHLIHILLIAALSVLGLALVYVLSRRALSHVASRQGEAPLLGAGSVPGGAGGRERPRPRVG